MYKYFSIIIFLVLIVFSCEKEAIHEYSVQNNCETSIIVNVLDYRNISYSIEIASSIEKVIYSGKIINSVYEDEITYFIKDIKIRKGYILLNKNLLDYSIWRFEKKNRLEAKSYLTVYPEDFEDE